RAGHGPLQRSAATWAGLVPLLGRPFDSGLRPVWPPVRPALRLALRARRNRGILPAIPRVLGGAIPPGSIPPSATHTPPINRSDVAGAAIPAAYPPSRPGRLANHNRTVRRMAHRPGLTNPPAGCAAAW